MGRDSSSGEQKKVSIEKEVMENKMAERKINFFI
jgi:hypothetical protein